MTAHVLLPDQETRVPCLVLELCLCVRGYYFNWNIDNRGGLLDLFFMSVVFIRLHLNIVRLSFKQRRVDIDEQASLKSIVYGCCLVELLDSHKLVVEETETVLVIPLKFCIDRVRFDQYFSLGSSILAQSSDQQQYFGPF
jgi:hypothetical protein